MPFCLHFVNKRDFDWTGSTANKSNRTETSLTCLTFWNHALIYADTKANKTKSGLAIFYARSTLHRVPPLLYFTNLRTFKAPFQDKFSLFWRPSVTATVTLQVWIIPYNFYTALITVRATDVKHCTIQSNPCIQLMSAYSPDATESPRVKPGLDGLSKNLKIL